MAVVFMLLTLLLPLPVGNDAQLVVTVHDERGEGVAGIVVEAHAADEQAVIAQAHTDAAGQALLEGITSSQVRLQGHDAEGITLHLHGADTTLALRVERNGVVIVDPTSWAQEPVPNATNSVAVEATPASTAPPLAAEPRAVEAPPAQSALPLVLLLVLLGLVAVLVLRARKVS
jgi:hypothetical protein